MIRTVSISLLTDSSPDRWANGNMAGAVEKRKATLAAKKAAQAAAEQKVGHIAPKPKAKSTPGSHHGQSHANAHTNNSGTHGGMQNGHQGHPQDQPMHDNVPGYPPPINGVGMPYSTAAFPYK